MFVRKEMNSPILYFSITPYNNPPFIHCTIGQSKIKQNKIIDSSYINRQYH